MKEKINDFLKSIFSIFTLIAIAGGGIIFLIFVIALIIGGDTATTLSVNASKKYMPYFIKSAAIGVMAGLAFFYTSKSHTLSLNEDNDCVE